MPKKTAQKRSGWKPLKSVGKKQKQTKLAFIVLIVIISVLLFGQIIRFIDSLFQPITDYTTFSKTNSWNGKTNFNLVIKSDKVSVVTFDPVEKKITLVAIPPETYIDVPGGYGKWQVRAIYDLGQQTSKEPKGAKLLTDSISFLVGLPINGIIEIDNFSMTPYQFVKSLKDNPLNTFSHLSKIESNLTTAEFVNLSFNISQIRFDKIIDLKLDDFNLLSLKTLSDGTDVLVAEPILLDNFIIDKLSDSKIRQEQISVAVFNGTKVPGIATKVARMITNMGGNVIISTNAPFLASDNNIELDKTFISSELNKDSYTYERLKEVFALDCSNNPNCDKITTDEITSRAQINVVVGRDFIDR